MDDADEIDLSEIALTFTMNSAMIIIEGILVVCLVIQFMSSFDYLTGNGQVIFKLAPSFTFLCNFCNLFYCRNIKKIG